MDPETSPPPLCELFGSCIGDSGSLDVSSLLEPPPPADPLLPSLLLFLGCVAFAMTRTLENRLGEDGHRYVAIGFLVAGIAVAGIRFSQSLMYNVSEEIGMAIDLVVAYGLPAIIAAVAGSFVGLGLDARLTPIEQDAP